MSRLQHMRDILSSCIQIDEEATDIVCAELTLLAIKDLTQTLNRRTVIRLLEKEIEIMKGKFEDA